jgi:hypothetical protein
MAEIPPTPTIRAFGFMMSSSDTNDDLDDSGSDANQDKKLTRPSTPRFQPPSPSKSDTSPNSSKTQHDDISYDLRAETRNFHQSQASVFDSAYVDGKRVVRTPSLHTPEEKERLARESELRDLQDNAAAQAEIALELTKPWCKDFPAECIPEGNYQLFSLLDERNIIENDLQCLLTEVALDGTPLDPNRDCEDLYHALSARHNNINRAMHTVFANSLNEVASSVAARASRKRRASEEPLPLTPPESMPVDEDHSCPYVHCRDHDSPPETVPSFDPSRRTRSANHQPRTTTQAKMLVF